MTKQGMSMVVSILAAVCISMPIWAETASDLKVNVRYQEAVPDNDHLVRVACHTQVWAPQETAIIICDMWNQHWCRGATRRVAELSQPMNRVVSRARDRGVFIIHAPSGTIDFYKDHPARRLAQNTPRAVDLPEGIANWCHWEDDREKQAGYPIDHSDGGCDCTPQCKQSSPWTRQVDTIIIKDTDAISDSGIEVWSLLEQRGIKNIIVMGVHTNMCVLGRPFGLRNLDRFGKNVVLMRDMTDTMYNSRMAPKVSHFTGTDLIVDHVEKYVCPTITSTVFTGEPAFRFRNDGRPLVVFLSAESEYSAADTLPGFAHDLELHHGLRCEILQGSPSRESDECHEISGMELLTQADLVVVFARRRAFPADQMQYLKDYLDRGGALIGLRTASHAFDSRGSGPADHTEWPTFDSDVLGGNYHGHHGAGPICTVTCANGADNHPILAGVTLPLVSQGSLYEVRPLAKTTATLLMGSIAGQASEPVAWTHQYRGGRVFYTSLGHPDDFSHTEFRKLLVNAVFWAMNKPASSNR
ncbi:MAG: ThuA domain-containing protein [Phycisphaerae bacterium]|nr:ThuA domain-containing protein [Phycisphaerae bacterium]